LIVTNANVVPSSSESEVEKRSDLKTRLPMLVGKSAKRDVVGLGLGLDSGRKNVLQEKRQASKGTNPSESTSRSVPSVSSMDALHDLHRKRREALLGIVSGLELGLETRLGSAQSGDESDACIVQKGLAISGSGDIDDKREDASEDGSVYMVEDEGEGDYGFVEVEEYDEGRPDDLVRPVSTSVEDLRGRCMSTPRHFSDLQGENVLSNETRRAHGIIQTAQAKTESRRPDPLLFATAIFPSQPRFGGTPFTIIHPLNLPFQILTAKRMRM
jgi:hypothetical protein